MKAIVATRFGPADGLELQDVPTPAPREGEVLIKVHASTVTAGDVMLRKLTFAPLFWSPVRKLIGMPPRKTVPGHEFAGQVEAIGPGVRRFKPGDRVYGTTTGLETGANAEYICLLEEADGRVLGCMPVTLSYAEAAAIPVGAMTALTILRRADIVGGDKVLIFGASGSVGTYAVQLAKRMGAEVTGVCSTRNVGLVESLGADNVIDYTLTDFTDNGTRYDVIFDAVGKLSASDCADSLREGGTFLTTQTRTHEEAANLTYLTELIEAGRLRPVIDRRYPLAKTAEAHRYVETGRKRGNVVILVAEAEA